MIGVPLALGFVIRKRSGEPFSVWTMGAIAFVASQVVHLPLNFALGLLGPARGVALLPLPIVGLVAGLSAGVCEETARYLALSFVLRDRRAWQTGVQFGAGHGGIEAIVLGVLALFGLVNVLLAPHASSLGLSLDDQAALRHGARQYWEMPWYLPVLAGYERLCAISFHIGASTLVLHGIVMRRVRWLLLAIALHTLLDFPIVFQKAIGHVGIYSYLTVAALGMLGICWWLRRRWPGRGLDPT